MWNKVALVSHKEEKEVLILLFNVIEPVVQMIKAGPRIDAIYEDANLDVSHKEMRQVAYFSFTRCIPDLKLYLVSLAAIIDLDQLLKVAH